MFQKVNRLEPKSSQNWSGCSLGFPFAGRRFSFRVSGQLANQPLRGFLVESAELALLGLKGVVGMGAIRKAIDRTKA